MDTVLIIISDTHISGIDGLSPVIVAAIREADIVVHLGDYTSLGLVEGLEKLACFRGVRGNMDSPAIKTRLPETDVVEVNGRRLGLIHGWGPPWGIDERVRAKFGEVDAVLFGHSHSPKNETTGGILLFNPGSATGRFPATMKTYGKIRVGDSIQGEIIPVG